MIMQNFSFLDCTQTDLDKILKEKFKIFENKRALAVAVERKICATPTA
jgi:hypothetical protein